MLYPPPTPPAQPPRGVVTGAGIITPLGLGWKANAEGFRSGRTAFRPVTLFDVSRQRTRQAAEVDLPTRLPQTRLADHVIRRLDRATLMLLHAVDEAWQQARWQSQDELPLVLGTTSGGMAMGEDYYRQALRSPHCHCGQLARAMHYQAQTQARLVCEAFGIGGPITIIANACASGTNAIGQAWELLRSGRCQRVMTGGYDALSLTVFSGFDSLQALSTTTCRPFDAQRDGLSLGEGAAILALETMESAERRGSVILGEIIGYGAALDLHHLTQPHPEGIAALQAMSLACRSAGIGPSDVDYINAHGTGTVLNDSSEAAAINQWAGERAATLPVSSTKSCVGHLLGAAGAVEAVVCLMTLQAQWLPPESALANIDPICRFQVVRKPETARVRTVLSNSFGFGGTNATLALRRCA